MQIGRGSGLSPGLPRGAFFCRDVQLNAWWMGALELVLEYGELYRGSSVCLFMMEWMPIGLVMGNKIFSGVDRGRNGHVNQYGHLALSSCEKTSSASGSTNRIKP